MSLKKIGRRHLIRGAAGVALALPAIEGLDWVLGQRSVSENLVSSKAAAAADATKKRFITLHRPNGTVQPSIMNATKPDLWWPISNANGGLTGPGGAKFSFNQCNAPLSQIRDHVSLIKGLDIPRPTTCPRGNGNVHWYGMTGLLTGAPKYSVDWGIADAAVLGAYLPNQPSLDHILAATLSQGQARSTIYVNAGGLAGDTASRISYEKNGDAIIMSSPYTSHVQIFDLLFSDHLTEVAELDALRARRGSVLDAVFHQCDSLGKHKLGTRGRQQLEQHCEHLREIEKRINTPVEACEVPEKPGTVAASIKLQELSKLVATAMACNITSVATMQYGYCWATDFNFDIPVWNNPTQIVERSTIQAANHHEGISHNTKYETHRTEWTYRDQWMSMQLVDLVNQLKSFDDGAGGTLFDNTLIFYTTELADGEHDQENMPFALVGGANTGLIGARYHALSSNAIYNRLLVTIQNALGLTGTTVGRTDWSAGGALPGIFA